MKRSIFFLAVFLFLAPTAFAQNKVYPTTTCTVIRVTDGDNVGCVAKVGRSTKYFNFRLLGIDAPELKGHQRGWEQSRDALRAMVLHKDVTIELRGFETKWNRNLVRVFIQDGNSRGWLDVGFQQVAKGHAWYRAEYARTFGAADKASYQTAHDDARTGKLGLWADSRPISPSDWRRMKR